MSQNYQLPPNPQHAVLKRIYPWDEYDKTLVMAWLYEQAKNTGFIGTIEDFKLRYGAYIEATDPQDVQDLIENYYGPYHITPLLNVEQTLKTENKVLNYNIIIDPIPEDVIVQKRAYKGNYQVTPLPLVDQVLRTEDKVMENNLVVEKIPCHKTSNDAGGYTFTIG